MKRNTRLLIIGIIIIGLVIPIYAEEIIDKPTVKVVYDGATPIKDAISIKASDAAKEGKSIDISKEMGLAAKSVMEKEKYPYNIPKQDKTNPGSTEIKIEKARYDEATTTMWYWIVATRDGQEVAVNNPIWISPAPQDITVSEVKDDIKNEVTVTLKEDPKAAAEQVLLNYVNGQPLGKAITGTKE